MGKFNRGNSKAAKLNAEKVHEILEKYNSQGYTQARLCREYGVGVNTIGRIVRGESWQSVPTPAREPTQDEINASMARILQLLNVDAAKLPIAKEIAADKALDLLLDPERAKAYGAKLD